ncbi:MAG: prepilin-type N-terminal cleavage/methylation domain-containing protein, partial [Actinomycetes bacterium]
MQLLPRVAGRWRDERRRIGALSSRSEAGFTLQEILLAVAILSVIMVPLLAWTLMTMDRASDNGVPNDTRAFAQLNRFLDRDVAAAKTVVWPVATPTPPSTLPPPPADPCTGAESASAPDIPLSSTAPKTVQLSLIDARGRLIAYVSQPGTERIGNQRVISVTRLYRRVCPSSGGPVSTVLISERFTSVSASCKPRAGTVNECGDITFRLRGDKGPETRVRAVFRLTGTVDTSQLPVADIRCLPSCREFRGPSSSVDITLDGSYSTVPFGHGVSYRWTLDDTSITLPTPTASTVGPLTFTCTRSMLRWNDASKGCLFKATLVITDTTTGQTSSRDQEIWVLNAVPVVSFTPLSINGFRTDTFCFDASATTDPDDPTGAGLSFLWFFADEAAGAVNTASGSGKPVFDCAAEAGTAGVVSHTYSGTQTG